MFEKFRQKSTSTIPYNETVDYKYLEIMGITGLHTTQPISLETIPDGYKAFALLGDPNYERITPAPNRKAKALFICKEKEADGLGRSKLTPEDCVFLHSQPFGWYEFRDFFGQSITFELLLKNAESKRLEQFAPKSKGAEKQNDSDF